MAEENLNGIEKVILRGFSDVPNLQGFLFGIFVIMYVSILTGNGLIVAITKSDPVLQTPMYFFLGNFSFLEICYTSVTLPRMLADLWTQRRNISLSTCAIQLGFFLILGGTECFLLAVMAYDRYVAICRPFYYPLIINYKVCDKVVICSWISAILVQAGLTYEIFSFPFCGSNKLNHIFCDSPPLVKLTCEDSTFNEFPVYANAVLFGVFPFLLILVSYIKIITTILKLPSATGRSKSFSTCSYHLIVVGLFFGSAIITYLLPKSKESEGIKCSLFSIQLCPIV